MRGRERRDGCWETYEWDYARRPKSQRWIGPPVPTPTRRFPWALCRAFGHSWEMRSLACRRCGKTQQQILVESRPAPTYEDVNAAYWCGVEDGRKIDRRRAYLLGYRRGAREVWGHVEDIFGRKAA